MEENNKVKVPIIRENTTAWRVRIKLFNWVTIVYGRTEKNSSPEISITIRNQVNATSQLVKFQYSN